MTTTAADIVSKLGGRMDGSGYEQQRVIDALRRLGAWPYQADKAPQLKERQRERKFARERERLRRSAFVERCWQRIGRAC